MPFFYTKKVLLYGHVLLEKRVKPEHAQTDGNSGAVSKSQMYSVNLFNVTALLKLARGKSCHDVNNNLFCGR